MNDKPLVEPDTLDLVTRYDRMMYHPKHLAYFGYSDFTNFGYWEEDTADQKQASERLVERLLDLVPDRRGRILDVACGKGATTRHLRRWYHPGSVTAINISARQIETARDNAPGSTFALMDAVALGFGDARFDTVLCVEAAFHFHTREQFLGEALRVLRPGGWLALSDILMSRESERAKPYRSEENYVAGPEAYRALLRRVGFEEVRVVDATRACWEGSYWYAVRYIHERYLRREVDVEAVHDFLHLTYRRARDIEHYLLAAGRKGSG